MLYFAVHEGLEPPLAEPESDVLPLHQWTSFIKLEMRNS